MCTFDEVKVCRFWPFFFDFLPPVTFCDLETNFFRDLWPKMTSDDLTFTLRKQTSRPTFWYIIYHLLTKSEICLFSEFLTSGDLLWPRQTFHQKAEVKSVIIIYHLPTFNDFLNLTYFRNLTSGDLCWPRDPFFWKADVKSVILIYTLSTFDDFWNMTFFPNFWPRVTFVDLLTPFFEKLTSKPSFWYTIYPPSMTFEI